MLTSLEFLAKNLALVTVQRRMYEAARFSQYDPIVVVSDGNEIERTTVLVLEHSDARCRFSERLFHRLNGRDGTPSEVHYVFNLIGILIG